MNPTQHHPHALGLFLSAEVYDPLIYLAKTSAFKRTVSHFPWPLIFCCSDMHSLPFSLTQLLASTGINIYCSPHHLLRM